MALLTNTTIDGTLAVSGAVTIPAPTLSGHAAQKAQVDALTGTIGGTKGADIASASSINLGAATGDFVDVTGTAAITALGTAAAGIARTVRFTGALTLTHNATSLILPGGANITTANGDVAMFRSLGSGNWKCVGYTKASGQSVVGGSAVSSVAGKTGAVTLVPGDISGLTVPAGVGEVSVISDAGSAVHDVSTAALFDSVMAAIPAGPTVITFGPGVYETHGCPSQSPQVADQSLFFKVKDGWTLRGQPGYKTTLRLKADCFDTYFPKIGGGVTYPDRTILGALYEGDGDFYGNPSNLVVPDSVVIEDLVLDLNGPAILAHQSGSHNVVTGNEWNGDEWIVRAAGIWSKSAIYRRIRIINAPSTVGAENFICLIYAKPTTAERAAGAPDGGWNYYGLLEDCEALDIPTFGDAFGFNCEALAGVNLSGGMINCRVTGASGATQTIAFAPPITDGFMIGCSAKDVTYGINMDTGPTNNLSVIGCHFHGIIGYGANFASGQNENITFAANHFELRSGATGLRLGNGTLPHTGRVTGNNFRFHPSVTTGFGSTPAITALAGSIFAIDGNSIDSRMSAGISATVFSQGHLTSNGTIPADGNTVTIGNKTYTFKTTLTPTEGQVHINGSADAALANLIRAINHSGTPNTDYKCAAAHTQVRAIEYVAGTIPGHSIEVVSIISGATGDTYATTKTGSTLSWGATTLTGGTGANTTSRNLTFAGAPHPAFTEVMATSASVTSAVATETTARTAAVSAEAASRAAADTALSALAPVLYVVLDHAIVTNGQFGATGTRRGDLIQQGSKTLLKFDYNGTEAAGSTYLLTIEGTTYQWYLTVDGSGSGPGTAIPLSSGFSAGDLATALVSAFSAGLAGAANCFVVGTSVFLQSTAPNGSDAYDASDTIITVIEAGADSADSAVSVWRIIDPLLLSPDGIRASLSGAFEAITLG